MHRATAHRAQVRPGWSRSRRRSGRCRGRAARWRDAAMSSGVASYSKWSPTTCGSPALDWATSSRPVGTRGDQLGGDLAPSRRARDHSWRRRRRRRPRPGRSRRRRDARPSSSAGWCRSSAWPRSAGRGRPRAQPRPPPRPRPGRSSSRSAPGRCRRRAGRRAARRRSPGPPSASIVPSGAISSPVGPRSPATRAPCSSATSRASRAPASLSSCTRSPRPCMSSRGRVPPKVLVVRMRAPASAYARWASRMTSGRSTFHSSPEPPSSRPLSCSSVPMPPSTSDRAPGGEVGQDGAADRSGVTRRA